MEYVSTPNTAWFYLALVVLAPFVGWFLLKTHRSQRARVQQAREEAEKQDQQRRRQQVSEGTHDQQGHRLCITCGDKLSRATQRAFKIVQREGWWDLMRRSFGAPARYNIKQAKKDEAEEVYCDDCAIVALLEHQRFLLRYEYKQREARLEAAVELRRWVKHGCNDVIARRIMTHDEEMRAEEPEEERAPVLPLHHSQNV